MRLNSLHLPDRNGMMKNGILKANKEYIVRLRNFLSIRLDSPNTPIRVICFTSTLHPSVREVLSEFDNSPALKVPAPLLSLSSRRGSEKKAEIDRSQKAIQNWSIQYLLLDQLFVNLNYQYTCVRTRKSSNPCYLEIRIWIYAAVTTLFQCSEDHLFQILLPK